jgi:hypothetical protein
LGLRCAIIPSASFEGGARDLMGSNAGDMARNCAESSDGRARGPSLLDCTACARIIGAFALFVST